MLEPLLFRSANERAVLGTSELRRQLSIPQAEGEIPGANLTGRRIPAEQTGAVRHAWQCDAVVYRQEVVPGQLLRVPRRRVLSKEPSLLVDPAVLAQALGPDRVARAPPRP